MNAYKINKNKVVWGQYSIEAMAAWKFIRWNYIYLQIAF